MSTSASARAPLTTSGPLVDPERRRLLGVLALAATPVLASCGQDSSSSADHDDSGADDDSNLDGTDCVLIAEETAGPYPLLAILSNTAIVRQDITEDRSGVPLTLVLKFVDVNNYCAPISGAAIYVWHCDKDGSYSGYSSSQNGDYSGASFLRGVQQTDSDGQAVFFSIYPGWYSGRITHIHFQVYLNNNLSVTATATSQLGFPQDVTQAVYGSELYAARGQNTSVSTFDDDNVFGDGVSTQLASVTGSVAEGYVASLVVGIDAG